MNTIEMLNEAINKHGEMYVQCLNGPFKDLIVCYDAGLGFAFVRKDRSFLSNVELNKAFMNCVWKPYVKPVDWSKVPIDTKVLARMSNGPWFECHFAKCVNSKPLTWADGRTSWTYHNYKRNFEYWDEIKLLEE